MWRLWMNQSCFSLGFLSQNSLWKFSIFYWYKGYLYWSEKGMRRVSFSKQSGLATWLSHESKPRVNWMASLGLLSYSATAGVTLQLPCMLHTCACFSDLPVACQSRDPVARPCWVAHFWAFLHTLSHTTLTWFPPKYRVSKCWITSKLAWNKANKMVD